MYPIHFFLLSKYPTLKVDFVLHRSYFHRRRTLLQAKKIVLQYIFQKVFRDRITIYKIHEKKRERE